MAFGKKKPAAAHKVNVYQLRPTAAQRVVLRDLGDRVSALWNAANYRCRQNYLAQLGVPGYTELCASLISDPNYRRLPSDMAQEVLAKLTEAWSSYFALLERFHNKEVSDKPGLPKYRKNKDGTRPTNLIVIKHPRSYRITPQSIDLSLPTDLRKPAGRLSLDHRGIRRWNGRDGRVEIVCDRATKKWHLHQSAELPETPLRAWTTTAGIDLGVRMLVSLSIQGQTLAHHFSGREPLKDFDYLGRQIAQEQQRLAALGLKSSIRLSRLHRDRRVRIEHLWRALAKRVVSLCKRQHVGVVALGWPKDILRNRTYGSGAWAENIHNFWSFDLALRILQGALRRAGIHALRVGERGSSSTCVHDDPVAPTHKVVRYPRAWITCKTCALCLHSDQVGSRNIARFANPNVRWDGPEAGPRTVTYRWTFQRWEAIPNPWGTTRLPRTNAA